MDNFKPKERFEEIFEYLSKTNNSNKFGLINGYIYSNVIKKIKFELFITSDRLTLKYPKPNIDENKIILLSNLVNEINSNFVYRPHNTTIKNKYSYWDLNTTTFSYERIANLILTIESNLFLD